MIIRYVWDATEMVMRAQERYYAYCRRDYVDGRVYPLTIHEERNMASHSNYMAAVRRAFESLPDDLLLRFTSADKLREFALIQAGYTHVKIRFFNTRVDAERASLLISQFHDRLDEMCVIQIIDPDESELDNEYVRDGYLLTETTAKSQSVAAMGNTEFKKSKADVLEIIAPMARMTVDQLTKAPTA
jgi:hypothetical protein